MKRIGSSRIASFLWCAKMDRVNQIWEHPRYRQCLKAIEEHEKEREFCRHNPEHFLTVARLTWILVLEEGLEADKELIYAAGLLHDIGRHWQYERGIPHDRASAELAAEILQDCGFNEKERQEVLHLIESHRTRQPEKSLAGIFYRADKLSRNCFSCSARNECNWPEEKKNLKITC